jgi:hypothetical protein
MSPWASIAADDMNRNWDSDRRLKEMHEDGVVAEVIFPNTQPPFAPMARKVSAAVRCTGMMPEPQSGGNHAPR